MKTKECGERDRESLADYIPSKKIKISSSKPSEETTEDVTTKTLLVPKVLGVYSEIKGSKAENSNGFMPKNGDILPTIAKKQYCILAR